MNRNLPCEALSDKEYLSCVKDIMEDKLFLSMKNYMQHGTTSTKDHCINVSYLSYKICKKCNLNYKAAARGGLLHDYYLYDWHTHYKDTGLRFHGITHPRTALNNALLYFNLSPLEKDIILHHMWPITLTPPQSREAFIINTIDKYCSLMEFILSKKHIKKLIYR